MNGHHLILGNLIDFISDKTIKDTHDERYRQKLARLLVLEKGYAKKEIESHVELHVKADNKQAIVWVDFIITLSLKVGMIIKYGPGSIITRHGPSLAAARIVVPYQIPIVVVSNGEDAEVLEGASGAIVARGLDAIPSRQDLKKRMQNDSFKPISKKQAEMASRIIYAFEVEGSCPCDDSVCRIKNEE